MTKSHFENALKKAKESRKLLLSENELNIVSWLNRGIVLRSELAPIRMTCGNEKKFKQVIDKAGTVYDWVGIGWVATRDEYKNQPIVCDM